MHLLVDAQNPEAGFNSAVFPSGDQLESVFYSQLFGYGGLPVQLNFLDNNGSGVPTGPPGSNVFSPGLASGQVMIVTDPTLAVGTRFGLKQVPTIPEPATVALLGLGCLMFHRKKKLS